MIKLNNSTLTLQSEDGLKYFIINNNSKKVGHIEITDSDPSSLSFEIIGEERGKHYASNAVYLLDSFAHKEKRIKVIRAEIRPENEMAKHVLEHSGYYIVEKNDSRVLYEHIQSETRKDDTYEPGEGNKVIYLAGGCFWGTERAFGALNGVVETKTGYANGHIDHPTYEDIIRNETGFKETVRVTYDPKKVALETILKAYFLVTDPTQADGQGEDIGAQYQSGIYYKSEDDIDPINSFIEEEKKKYSNFFVEIKPIECFYEAEEYHQDYLTKNPDGYCHISLLDIKKIKDLNTV
ncbi:MAG: peptide-methionine (S)-S-oxide reductase MsrA [Lachnospiraceae bacterium]|nr:peptide-methionine (S)-S-oxide reductase MsrA [Lachnospiraceae bacterium]